MTFILLSELSSLGIRGALHSTGLKFKSFGSRKLICANTCNYHWAQPSPPSPHYPALPKKKKDDIYTNIMGHIISFEFITPMDITLLKQVIMIRINEKCALKQETIQIISRLHTIGQDKEATKRY